MKRLQFLFIMLVTACMCSLSVADDGAIANKSMSKTIDLPTFDEGYNLPPVEDLVPEAEHAFTDMMGFYVPAQAANGLVLSETAAGGIPYCDIDNQPPPGEDCAAPVETLAVAKPLLNVFIFGPAFGVDGTAYAHSFMDTYAAVSLDDGETWKHTNLSESADQSSFNLDTDHIKKGDDPLPGDHRILLGSKNNGAMHAPGYEIPYTSHCTECHGPALTGTAQAPSCYSCHGSRWKEEPFEGVGPLIYQAIYKNNKVEGFGENAGSMSDVAIINGGTGEELWYTDATLNGDFHFVERPSGKPPCTIAAVSEDERGPSVPVTDKNGEPLDDEKCEGFPIDVTEYPGGAYNVFHATAGNKVLVAWPSRYCEQGQPAFSLTTESESDSGLTEDEKAEILGAITTYLKTGEPEAGIPPLDGFTAPTDGTWDGVDDLYLVDAFGVAGSQKSSDFADEGYPQAGVVPFGCVWTARGVLLPGDDLRTEEVTEASYMVWTKAERLTSGRRDPNRIEVRAVKDAGFVITWQEDPEGLRPGQGLGPGEGWSGAIAHPQTDVWYSFINYEYFDVVEDPSILEGPPEPINILDAMNLTGEDGKPITGRPQTFVPMSVPMRLTNNAKCTVDSDTGELTDTDLYCHYDGGTVVDGSGSELVIPPASNFGLKDQCADVIDIYTGNIDGPGLTLNKLCVVDSDGDAAADLPNRANTGATRPRLGLQGYNPSEDDKSAWVVVAMEESKGLGKYFFRPDDTGDGYAEPCTVEDSVTDPTCTEEIGKNQWYFSFDMGTPDTSAGFENPNSLVNNLVSQGNMLNQAEIYWDYGELYGLMSTLEMEDYGDYNFDIVNTEIARRASLLVQSIAKAQASSSKLVAIPSWKQGVMRQGGPADTMLRRFVLPDDFDSAVDNPYAFENMVCETFLIDPGNNPYYPGGVCADPATNLSGVIPDTCLDDGTDGAVNCPTVDFTDSTFGRLVFENYAYGPYLNGVEQGVGDKTRVLTWHQCPSDGIQTVGDFTAVTCADDDRTDAFANLMDQSWYNPLDISKGHRGFLDGDFVMFLYAWSPNWRLNAKGKDRYDLYVRRSFDGGMTWGTTPSSFVDTEGQSYALGDGTVTCETYRRTETGGASEDLEPRVCYSFGAGEAEHARNVTQHKSMRTTTLDPRYAPARATIADGCTDGLFPDNTVIDGLWTCDDTSVDYDSDLRDASRYFMVFETGDNSTVEVGEAEPLDLFYGRAESFGDDYVVWTETDTGYDTDPTAVCYPSVDYGVEDLGVVVGSGFCNEFDNMNTGGDTHSSEANLEANPDGSKLYGVWGQWVFDDHEEVSEADAQARRIWWIDNYRSENDELIYTLPGSNQDDSGSP